MSPEPGDLPVGNYPFFGQRGTDQGMDKPFFSGSISKNTFLRIRI
jgi:hypothetical protein